MNNIKVDRPWGSYELLKNSDGFWIKLLTIHPLQRISLQSHKEREEYWTVISGEGIAQVNDEKGLLEVGTNINIPKETTHRVYNTNKKENLLICETAIGNCNEGDINRYSDDYGR